jgi:hypothetical protein
LADDETEAFLPPLGNVSDWRKILQGVTLIWIATLMAVGLAVLAAVGAFTFAALASYDRFGEPPTGYVAMRICVGIALLVILLIKGLQFVGHVCCLWAPTAHGAKALAIASFVMVALGFGLQMVGGIINVAEGGSVGAIARLVPSPAVGEVGFLLRSVGQIIDYVEIIVFLLFLRAIAQCIHDRPLQDNVRQLLFLAGASITLAVAVFSMLLVAAFSREYLSGLTGGLGIGCACMLGMSLVCTLIGYIIVLGQVRMALASYIHRLERV